MSILSTNKQTNISVMEIFQVNKQTFLTTTKKHSSEKLQKEKDIYLLVYVCLPMLLIFL